MSKLTTSYLRHRLRYEPETGALVWLARPVTDFPNERLAASWNARFAGKHAGTIAGDGRRYVTIDARHYRTARVIWQIMTGSPPPRHVDHWNGNNSDDCWANLRLASQHQNMGNMKRHRDGRSGFKGVTRLKNCRYKARINARHLGYFDTPEEAHIAYLIAALEVYGEFARAE
jgi:HNH endonuclease